MAADSLSMQNQIPARLPGPFRAFLVAHAAELQASGGGEWRFALEVLGRVDGLPWSELGYQVPIVDDQNKNRRTDFTLPLPSGGVLALEVDGWDKRGTGKGMDRADFDDWLSRQNALTLSGFAVLRFSNAQVSRDPMGCARRIEWALRGSCLPLPGVRGFSWAWLIQSPFWWSVAGLVAGWLLRGWLGAR